MTEELKPCPFCGSENQADLCDDLDGKNFYVACGRCGSSSGHRSIRQSGDPKEIVTARWNTRPIEDALRSRIKELEANSKPYTYIGKDGKSVLARDLEDERDALKAENKRLREALEPFSKMAGVLFCRNFNNEDVVMHVELPARVGCGELTAKHFFTARQALNPGKEGKSK